MCIRGRQSTTPLTGSWCCLVKCLQTIEKQREKLYINTWAKQKSLGSAGNLSEWILNTVRDLIMRLSWFQCSLSFIGVTETFLQAEPKLKVKTLPYSYFSLKIWPFSFHSARHMCAHICVLTQTRASLHNITWQTHAAARCLIIEKNSLSTQFSYSYIWLKMHF